MDRAVELALVERALAHASADTRDGAATVTRRPVSDYLDPQRFADEQQALFRDHPVVVGHVSQLAGPGSFFTHDHSGLPLLVTRDDSGAIGAFANVCRHRGARLCDVPCGTARRLTCPFHGWTYDLTGRLRGVPQADGFAGVDLGGYGLAPVPVAERHGLIFVRPRVGGAPIDLDRILTGVDADLATTRPQGHLLALRHWEVACNWKVLLDNFLEMYHVPVLHAGNIGPMFEPNRSLFDRLGQNGRRIDPRRSIRHLAGEPRDTWRLRDHALVTYHVFPNIQTFWTQDYFSWLSVWPVDVGRSICVQCIVADWPADTDERRAHLQTNLDLFDRTLAEDFAMSEGVQAGLRSGALAEVTFARFETGAAAVHDAVDEVLGRYRRGQPVDAWPGC
jgi:phenylpropionate dioxygenase-like ring-hydroxylating dioxygenase large terminal subunit